MKESPLLALFESSQFINQARFKTKETVRLKKNIFKNGSEKYSQAKTYYKTYLKKSPGANTHMP